MSKTFFAFLLFIFTSGIFLFHSCSKDKGPLPPKPFNFNLTEGFESSANLPSGWSLYNPDGDAAWQVVTTVAHTGSNCIGFNNCNGDGTADMAGRKDRFITNTYNFTGATSASISFDHAYAYFNFKSQILTDTLAVYASSDGGSTWTQIYLKGGSALGDTTSAQPCWAPASTDWRSDNIIVNNLAGKASVKFAFENRSGWGEWIYIDNISINATNVVTNCAGITFAKDIQPIIQSQCAISGCHVPGANTDFTTYAGLNGDVVNGSFKQRVMDGPNFMPASGKLPSSMLSKIQCWLDNGAPNN